MKAVEQTQDLHPMSLIQEMNVVDHQDGGVLFDHPLQHRI